MASNVASEILTVAAYREAERRALERLSADHIRAFSPATFRFHGYPDAAETDAAVMRYVDTMQELNDPLGHQVADFSAAEAGLIEEVCEHVVALTADRFGRSIRPWQGPLTTMKVFRAVQELARATRKPRLRIFEIGPGSGYLGALLVAAGHSYISSDIAQGFYLWQSLLQRAVSGGDFVEGALNPGYSYGEGARSAHMPWWDYATLYDRRIPEVDIVICDHAMGEMNPYALRFTCQLAQLMLRSTEVGLVVFESVGEPRFNSDEAVRLNFARVGLDRMESSGPVRCIGRDGAIPETVAKVFRERPPLFNPDGNPKRLKGRDIVPVRADEAPPSYAFYKFLGYDVPEPTR